MSYSLTYSLNMPIPDEMHVKALRSTFPKIVEQMKEQYEKLIGEKVWSH